MASASASAPAPAPASPVPTGGRPFKVWNRARTAKNNLRGRNAPVDIPDFHIDPAKWKDYIGRKHGKKTKKGKEPATVESVLGLAKDEFRCLVCNEFGDVCDEADCRLFWAEGPLARLVDDCEIKHTGKTKLSRGLYVKPGHTLLQDRYLGHFTGELLPPDGPGAADSPDMYVFETPEVANVSAHKYGNATRFINHGCFPNVVAEKQMIAGRRVIAFRILENIYENQQVLVDYGNEYFFKNDIECMCGHVMCRDA